MKKTFVIIFLSTINLFYSQDKTISFNVKKGEELLQYKISKQGQPFIVMGKEGKDLTIISYDSLLNLNYEKSFKSSYKGLPGFFGRGMYSSPIYYDLRVSIDGKYAVSENDKKIFYPDGRIIDTKIESFFYPKDIDHNSSFISNENLCIIGKEMIEVKKGKYEKSDNSIFLFRNLNDLNVKKTEFKTPKIESNQEVLKWGLSSYHKNFFFMVNKELNKERTNDKYNIVKYDYNGEILSLKSVEIKLNKKYFTASFNGFGAYAISYTGMASRHEMSSTATGNIYTDLKNNDFYIYGLYTNDKDNDFYQSTFGGFYIHKFNSEGELIWKMEKPIVDTKDFNKNSLCFHMQVDFYNLNNGQIGFAISKSNNSNFAHLFSLNEKDGKIIKSKKIEFKVNDLMREGIKNGSFPTGFNSETIIGKNNGNIETLFSTFFNPKIESFFKKNKATKLNYKTNITENGVFLIEEDNKNNKFRILKFNN
ncbi:MAG: hypothetical protein L6Q46_09280 [Flavobacterium sp.]|uniref:hypothetical protein n=1 Tax=Flavobacterium sp. TaxID=239 RepID=UPI0025C2D4C8|nr:hypothetical protein [Flavobacterium sp.]MCK6608476.1 hypothetical protein [Flavobacterium sp.]